MKTIVLFLKGFFGFHNIHDGSTCEFSKRFWDIHDYHEKHGGDGIPTHFCAYKCPKCGRKFVL